MKSSVLMIVKSGVFDDARVRRAAATLSEAGYHVEIIGDRPSSATAIEGVSTRFARPGRLVGARRASALRSSVLARWLLLPAHRRRDDRRFREAVMSLEIGPHDMVHCNDFNTLEFGSVLADRWGAAVVYDAHECWTGRRQEGHPTPWHRLRTRRVERRLGTAAHVRITVSAGLAAWFDDHYEWSDTVVVHNSFPHVDGRCELVDPRAVVYAGRVDASRDLKTAVAAFTGRDGLTLDIVGPADELFAAELEQSGAVIHDPVDVDDLIERYRLAGLALVSLSGGQLNHRIALPNKLFQAVQAGVPVIAADLPEIRRYVTEFGIGVLYQPGSVASMCTAVDTAVARYGELLDNVRSAAPHMAWQSDEERLLYAYSSVAGQRPATSTSVT